jgi:1-acyl-sn-glycerol-3-phosphate acyltransferase
MSIAGGQGGVAPASAAWHPLLAVPLAFWRLLRMLMHVLMGYVLSYLSWRRLNEQGRHDVTLNWSRHLLLILGIRLDVTGHARAGAKLVVANHVSWLDIVAINSTVPSRFVSKAEVSGWPLVGRLVTVAGTLYLVRERRRDAMRVLGLMCKALRQGHTVAVFPEGTTGTGEGVLHFHGNLLQAAIDAEVPIQPVALRYSDPAHIVSRRAAYAGDMTLMRSLWLIVTSRGLCVHVAILSPQSSQHADRRALAALLEGNIAGTLASSANEAQKKSA